MLDDMWIVYMDNFGWEPLKIINNYIDPLFAHQTFVVPQGPFKDNVLVFGGLTQDFEDQGQIRDVSLKAFGNQSVFMLDFQEMASLSPDALVGVWRTV